MKRGNRGQLDASSPDVSMQEDDVEDCTGVGDFEACHKHASGDKKRGGSSGDRKKDKNKIDDLLFNIDFRPGDNEAVLL